MDYSFEFLKSKEKLYSTRHKGVIGKSFNRLIALFPLIKSLDLPQGSFWAFKCICGKYTVQKYSEVSKGITKSCGCMKGRDGQSYNKLKTISHLLDPDCSVQLTVEGSVTGSRDWGFRCKVCNIEGLNLNTWEVLRSGKKFCKCSGKFTCGTRLQAKEDLQGKLKGTTWDLAKFPEHFTTKSRSRVELICKVCDSPHEVSFFNAYHKGCPNCADKATVTRLSKDTKWFVESCNKVHNYKYDYDKVQYKTAKEKVEIVCNEHQEPYTFWQSPDNHKNKGKGCPECKRIKLKYVTFHITKAERNKEKYSKVESGVYLIKLSNGIFKIGVSCDIDRRLPEIRRSSSLGVDLVYYRKLNLYNALKLENALHKDFKEKSFSWDYQWEGYTECFCLNGHDQNYVINTLKNYEEL